MKIILACGQTVVTYNLQHMVDHLLVTYYDIRQEGDPAKYFRVCEESGTDVLLDSGAFGAWTREDTLEVSEYAQFIRDLPYEPWAIASLDVIPGAPGKYPTPKQKDEAAVRGWENYQALLKEDVAPAEKIIHIFHQGEDFKWLKLMMEQCEYIGLSPANDRGRPEKLRWLDRCMEYVCDEEGKPKVKFHGFAVSGINDLLRYPWYSADASTWVRTPAYGFIPVPAMRGDGSRDYLDNKKVHFSVNRDDYVEEEFAYLSADAQEYVRNYVADVGITVEDVAAAPKNRFMCSIYFWTHVEKAINEVHTNRFIVQESLF